MTDAQPRDLLGPAALLLMRLQDDHPPWRPLWHRATPHVLAAWAGRLYSPARASHGLPLKVLIMLMLMPMPIHARGSRPRDSVRYIGTHPLLPAAVVPGPALHSPQFP
ncbi:unnamed protein product [Fusarium graminearum]|uniref:Uncharacterized protein n=1 Tax=Gibberella zeae TaxID=5518 RepID=A0A4E9E3R9_GIBZA|nr:unnamed protein product [Fusarium graminearum]CAF3606354.1 unnamed protein product [Fusarium graminearum]CAF3630706.1 unnamed protein product [Fusarium graminearum]CAG1969088.1 unnamed protein product [Fusarium graminearum]